LDILGILWQLLSCGEQKLAKLVSPEQKLVMEELVGAIALATKLLGPQRLC